MSIINKIKSIISNEKEYWSLGSEKKKLIKQYNAEQNEKFQRQESRKQLVNQLLWNYPNLKSLYPLVIEDKNTVILALLEQLRQVFVQNGTTHPHLFELMRQTRMFDHDGVGLTGIAAWENYGTATNMIEDVNYNPLNDKYDYFYLFYTQIAPQLPKSEMSINNEYINNIITNMKVKQTQPHLANVGIEHLFKPFKSNSAPHEPFLPNLSNIEAIFQSLFIHAVGAGDMFFAQEENRIIQAHKENNQYEWNYALLKSITPFNFLGIEVIEKAQTYNSDMDKMIQNSNRQLKISTDKHQKLELIINDEKQLLLQIGNNYTQATIQSFINWTPEMMFKLLERVFVYSLPVYIKQDERMRNLPYTFINSFDKAKQTNAEIHDIIQKAVKISFKNNQNIIFV